MSHLAAPFAPVKMTRRRRLMVQSVLFGVWATGLLWLPLHYFLMQKTRFGTAPNPVEPWMLKAHGAFAFAALWSGGLLWGLHIVGGWRSGRRRWSGIAVSAAGALLIASGWLLYYAGDEELRAVTSVVHWGIGLASPVAFLWHRLVKGRKRLHGAHRQSPPLREEKAAAG
jgi:hypothetical protein